MRLFRKFACLAAAIFSICVPAAASFAQAAASAPPAAITDLDYRLGPGDKIRMIVFGEDNLTGEFFIGANGKVSLPLIGDMSALGSTVGELQTNVQTALKEGYLTDPKVSVEVLTYRPFYILGEVNRPGTYPYTSGLTVLTAVATAQGFTYRANTRKVYIKRASEGSEQEVKLGKDVLIQPGDTIRITERFF